jgi:hypothetical protein
VGAEYFSNEKKDVSEGTRGFGPERPAMIQTRLSKSTVISIAWIADDTGAELSGPHATPNGAATQAQK